MAQAPQGNAREAEARFDGTVEPAAARAAAAEGMVNLVDTRMLFGRIAWHAVTRTVTPRWCNPWSGGGAALPGRCCMYLLYSLSVIVPARGLRLVAPGILMRLCWTAVDVHLLFLHADAGAGLAAGRPLHARPVGKLGCSAGAALQSPADLCSGTTCMRARASVGTLAAY